MSHFTEMKTQLKERETIVKALKNLGFKVEEANQPVTVRGFMGNTSTAEFKALTYTHYDIGFVKNSEGSYEINADWEVIPKACGIDPTTFANDLKREYARVSILEIAKASGLEVETMERDGVIEMVVSQW